MPPRKKFRGNIKAPPTPIAKHPALPTPAAQINKSNFDPLKDPWTDEQETSLYKGIIQWKPAGLHKHFRMIAISEYLRNHGYDPRVDEHTRIPGIWEKLGREYNLPAIDEREKPSPHEENLEEIHPEFSLPREQFEAAMFERGRRKDNEAGSTPPRSRSPSIQPTRKRKRADTVTKNRASTVDNTDDTRVSPPTSSTVKMTRAGRNASRALGKSKAESGSRQASKDTTMGGNEGISTKAEEDGKKTDVDRVEAEDEPSSPRASKSNTKVKGPIKSHNSSRKSKRKK